MQPRVISGKVEQLNTNAEAVVTVLLYVCMFVCLFVCSTVSGCVEHSHSTMCDCDGWSSRSRQDLHGKEAYAILQLDGHRDERSADVVIY